MFSAKHSTNKIDAVFLISTCLVKESSQYHSLRFIEMWDKIQLIEV